LQQPLESEKSHMARIGWLPIKKLLSKVSK
jgi:hypothetical protein